MAQHQTEGGKEIEKSLFGFIWKYSKRQQIGLLLVTIALFPFLYLTLELPKRIINDAIGSGDDPVVLFGVSISQVNFLFILCGLFLLAVLAHGLLKMRVNTMKGVLAERLLRRFRYDLVTRIFRFPKPYFQRTSQGEIVSMVTAESEPLGGMMGDAIAQPVFQAGQMLTILTFLFLQSVWFGLAAIALIPLQAWLIPMLQRQINKLNKKRIREVRQFAAEIGETAAGTTALRTSGGYRFRSAQVTDRLGKLFFIRLEIYKKKFFMKFLNNFINQLTPFFFFSIGGYLVIRGNVSIGALVAALAAYKDLSSPWKELLTYYNMFHEMSQRWTLITQQFAPTGMLDEKLFGPPPKEIEHLNGDIVFDGVTARDADGIKVVDNINLTFPKGSLVAIAAPSEEDRRVLAELLTRELLPSEGKITIAGKNLNDFHQAVIGGRIGWADSKPYVFAGRIGDNVMMSLKTQAKKIGKDSEELVKLRTEAERSGNSLDLANDDWVDPTLAGMRDEAEIQTWWLRMVEGIGADRELLRRALSQTISTEQYPELTATIVKLRKTIQDRLQGSGLHKTIHAFDEDKYNPSVPLLHNILYAVPKGPITHGQLARNPDFLRVIKDIELEGELFDVAQSVTNTLFRTFGADGTDHPLFRRLGIDADSYDQVLRINRQSKKDGLKSLSDPDLSLFLALPCLLSPELFGEFATKDLQARIVHIRNAQAEVLRKRAGQYFQPLVQADYSEGLTILENAIFGVINKDVGARAELLLNSVAATLVEQGLKGDLAALTLDEETTLGGTNLPPRIVERIAFTRAAIKRPDIFVLDKVLGSYDDETRFDASIRLRQEMPEATIIYLEDSFRHPENFDVYAELRQGRIVQGEMDTALIQDAELALSAPDLATKLQSLEQTVFFSGLDRKQLRLLAFSAQWFDVPAGEVVFYENDRPTDGAYLILKGEADFITENESGEEVLMRRTGPGSLVGELALILGQRRALTMRARTELGGLRIGNEEFLAVIQNDAQTAFKLLQLITGYLAKAPREEK